LWGDPRVSPTMPDLIQSLHKHDTGHLKIVAELWGIELSAKGSQAITRQLCAAMLNRNLLSEILESLPPDARSAVDALHTREGRIPWAEFIRQYGDIREMGPGKRDRERPYTAPASPAEALFYRALLARAFFSTPSGPLEFAYIPDDLFALMRSTGSPQEKSSLQREPLGRPASPSEKTHIVPADDFILDEATSLLAALRLGIAAPETRIPSGTLQALLGAAGLLKSSLPQPQPTRVFLEAARHEALKLLTDGWAQSSDFNELRQVPGLILEGEWHNRPREAREFLLGLLGTIPNGTWWSMPAFVQDIKENHPDFQRPAGEYDSWFIKRASDGTYLRGFEHWDQVEGALLRYLISGPLFWLRQVDLAAPAQGQEPTAFMVRPALTQSLPENSRWHVSSQGKITVPRFTPRTARYQISRFCQWLEPGMDEYQYQITPASLQRATRQELNLAHLLPLLAKHSQSGVPPSLVKALKRWQAHGTEARVKSQVLLRVSKPEVLEALRKSKAARFLDEVLGPTTVIVKEGAQSKVLAALAELGFLAEQEE
jgi:hypothetical protein